MSEFIEQIRCICDSPARFDLHDWAYNWAIGFREPAAAYRAALQCE